MASNNYGLQIVDEPSITEVINRLMEHTGEFAFLIEPARTRHWNKYTGFTAVPDLDDVEEYYQMPNDDDNRLRRHGRMSAAALWAAVGTHDGKVRAYGFGNGNVGVCLVGQGEKLFVVPLADYQSRMWDEGEAKLKGAQK